MDQPGTCKYCGLRFIHKHGWRNTTKPSRPANPIKALSQGRRTMPSGSIFMGLSGSGPTEMPSHNIRTTHATVSQSRPRADRVSLPESGCGASHCHLRVDVLIVWARRRPLQHIIPLLSSLISTWNFSKSMHMFFSYILIALHD
eukprot:g19099.t1